MPQKPIIIKPVTVTISIEFPSGWVDSLPLDMAQSHPTSSGPGYLHHFQCASPQVHTHVLQLFQAIVDFFAATQVYFADLHFAYGNDQGVDFVFCQQDSMSLFAHIICLVVDDLHIHSDGEFPDLQVISSGNLWDFCQIRLER